MCHIKTNYVTISTEAAKLFLKISRSGKGKLQRPATDEEYGEVL
jgi:hypothetical protein